VPFCRDAEPVTAACLSPLFFHLKDFRRKEGLLYSYAYLCFGGNGGVKAIGLNKPAQHVLDTRFGDRHIKLKTDWF
jgi:hypothetical protein